MFNLSENSRLRGSGHLVLNILRALNIISLLTISAASWAMIVMTTITNGFFFFDGVSHFFTSIIAMVLIVSELNLFKTYFQNNWPVLTPEHGLSWLGISMVMMGCQTLGNLNKPATSIDAIGLPMWRLVLGGGILGLTLGIFNIISSIIFRDPKNNITSRHIRTDGSLASAKNSLNDGYSTRSNSVKEEKPSKRWTQKFFNGTSRPKISQPIPHHDYDVEQQRTDDSWKNEEWKGVRTSPVVPDLRRPDTALHPMNSHVTRYSTASGITQF